MSASRQPLALDYTQIRKDLYSSKPLDLTPMLEALRHQDQSAVNKLLELGFKLTWVDAAHKKTVVRILAEEGNITAIKFLYDSDIFTVGYSYDLTPNAIHGAAIGGHKELLEWLDQYAVRLSPNFYANHLRIGQALMGKLPSNQEIEIFLSTSKGYTDFGDILYQLAFNGQSRTAIKLLDDYVEFKLSKLDYHTRTYNSLAKYDIQKDLIMNHGNGMLYDYLIKGAKNDDQFTMSDAHHFSTERFQDRDHPDESSKLTYRAELTRKLTKAISDARQRFSSANRDLKIAEACFEYQIEEAIESGHFHEALRLCDLARELNNIRAYFRVLIKAACCAMKCENPLMLKLILRRFPTDFEFDFDQDFDTTIYRLYPFHFPTHELIELASVIQDPSVFIIAAYILNPLKIAKTMIRYQDLLGVSAENRLTYSELQSLFSNRALINLMLSGFSSRHTLALNHNMHDKLLATLADNHFTGKQLNFIKQVVLANKQRFLHTAARKKIPESYSNFSEYLRIYNDIHNRLTFYIKNGSGYHTQKAKMLLGELEKTVNIDEIKLMLNNALQTFSYYSFYEFTFARVLPNDLNPVLRECVEIANPKPRDLSDYYL